MSLCSKVGGSFYVMGSWFCSCRCISGWFCSCRCVSGWFFGGRCNIGGGWVSSVISRFLCVITVLVSVGVSQQIKYAVYKPITWLVMNRTSASIVSIVFLFTIVLSFICAAAQKKHAFNQRPNNSKWISSRSKEFYNSILSNRS